MKHIVKILSLLVAISAFWIGLLMAAIVPPSHILLLPIYFVVSLGCYGLLMVGIGLLQFPTCPQEAVLLQQRLKTSSSTKVSMLDLTETIALIFEEPLEVEVVA